jgi:acetyl-CoA/propionyl-CoA carboxylase biotin carboxyl carrier protein
MFTSVLVANRGEIACRVIRTLRSMGIRSIAVYSDADRDALHVALADDAVRIGSARASESYLSIPAVIDAAVRSGAEAIHPGYGFLSENAEFARACAAAGIVFVGPSPEAIDAMGDKLRAKAHVAQHGVPVIPGGGEAGMSDAELVAAGAGVGFPLIIKPSAGGGGKGMTVVERQADLADGIVAARRIASAAFGDDTLLLERYLPSPRHIEVQVLADQHGHTIHLGERECSLQRRHQKVIEEAPSPLLDAATRARMGEAACAVARSVGYTGAGTVEFLISDERPDEFFFMETNTRLQVEHPVTEMVTGLDLVEWQLRIAVGEVLHIAQDDVVLRGHAIEARVYAEDPEHGFLPSAGPVLAVLEPQGEGIRVDSGVRAGSAVTTDYDPMLAKVIAWGPDRASALRRLDRALAGTAVLGVTTNVRFLRTVLADEDVRAGRLDTGLLGRLPAFEPGTPGAAWFAAAAASAPPASGPWQRLRGWRIGEHAQSGVPVRWRDELIVADRTPGDFLVAIGPDAVWLARDGRSERFELLDRDARLAEHVATLSRSVRAGAPEVRASMPGTVVTVQVQDGTAVEPGQPLVTVEAMKMEHSMLASVAGTVTIQVAVGDQVRQGQVVATIDPPKRSDEMSGAAA